MSEIAKVEQPHQGMVTQIERIACDPNVDINKLEKLWDMQQQAQDREAAKAYNRDMAALQSEMPVITKSGEIAVNGVVRSKYARFEDIVQAIQPLLDKHGFSVSFKTEFMQGFLQIEGAVSHREGHKESTKMTLPFDDSGSKNKVQAIGSSVSYGKRYVLCMLLNIAASGEDDDGVKAAGDEVEKIKFQLDRLAKMGHAIRENLQSITYIKDSIASDDLPGAAEAWFELSEEVQRALWVAPTDGGVFTTAERKIMKEQLRSALQGDK